VRRRTPWRSSTAARPGSPISMTTVMWACCSWIPTLTERRSRPRCCYWPGHRWAVETGQTAGDSHHFGGAARSEVRTRAGRANPALDLKGRARFGSVLPVLPSPRACNRMFRAARCDGWGVLSAGCGWPARTPFGSLVRALPVVAWTECGASCLWLVGPCICWRVGGTRDLPVEVLFP
jgi:hypothetical protein